MSTEHYLSLVQKKIGGNKVIVALIALVLLIIFGVAIFLLLNTTDHSDKDIAELYTALNAEGETSLVMIDKAYGEKKLDEETALIYKVYSVFGDTRLPKDYSSEKLTYEGTWVMNELTRKWDSLSDKTKALLEPFRKRPDEEGSWLDLESTVAGTSASTSWVIPDALAERANAYTEFLISADGKVKIWFPSVSLTMRNIYVPGFTVVDAAVGKKMAEKIKGFLDRDKIIANFEGLLERQLMSDGTRGGDGKLDIYVAPCGKFLGLTYPEKSTPAPSHIIMNYSIGANRDVVLKTTLAHEIFHSFQYVYKYDTRKDDWWSEATAVWSEDFIYAEDNSEQGRVKGYFDYPAVSLFKETPPPDHHYSAYVFPFFVTKKEGNGFMKKSWNACDGADCLEGIDKSIDGGFKKQWKEFTLWNYNREPAKYYKDHKGFPPESSENSVTTMTSIVNTGAELVHQIRTLKPLSAELNVLSISFNDDEKVKKLVFNDLRNFTGKSDKAGIKAVLYYKNGKNAVEDWTDKKQRAFCLENDDENLEKAVLIFSNADMKKEIEKTSFKTVGRSSCFEINQDDKRSAVIHFPYMNAGSFGSVSINTATDTRSEGGPMADAPEEALYDYQSKWKMWFEFEQIRDAFTFPCGTSTLDFPKGWITRSAGYLEFDLSPDKVGKDGTFPVDLVYGYAHPRGIYEEIPEAQVKCLGLRAPESKIDVTQYKGTMKKIYTGKITEMTSDGAKIELPNACMYHNCVTQDGKPFQEMSERIILTIKKGLK